LSRGEGPIFAALLIRGDFAEARRALSERRKIRRRPGPFDSQGKPKATAETPRAPRSDEKDHIFAAKHSFLSRIPANLLGVVVGVSAVAISFRVLAMETILDLR